MSDNSEAYTGAQDGVHEGSRGHGLVARPEVSWKREKLKTKCKVEQ